MSTTKEHASPIDSADEELIDTLIAINVVAKRLAAKLRQKTHIFIINKYTKIYLLS